MREYTLKVKYNEYAKAYFAYAINANGEPNIVAEDIDEAEATRKGEAWIAQQNQPEIDVWDMIPEDAPDAGFYSTYPTRTSDMGEPIPTGDIEYVSDGSYESGSEDEITYIAVPKQAETGHTPEIVEEAQITTEDVEAAWLAYQTDGYGQQFGGIERLTPNEREVVEAGRELLKHYKLVRGQRSMYPSKRGLEDCVAMTIVPSGYLAGSEVSVYVGLAPKVTNKGKALKLYIPAGYSDKIEQLMTQLTAQGIDLTDQRGHQSISALFRHLIDGALATN